MSLSSSDTAWAPIELEAGSRGCLRHGAFRLWVRRETAEWRFQYVHGDDLYDETFEWLVDDEPVGTERGLVDPIRVVSESASNRLAPLPRLADRTLVVRPETIIRMLPEASVDLYVSSPLWIAIHVGEPERQVLDVPTWPLSDTWFGPTTTQGELGYALRTNARLHLDNVLRPGHRAVTQLHLENRTGENVDLERIALPMVNLSLYRDEHGGFWTQSVSVRLTAGGTTAEVDIGKGPSSEAGHLRLVAEPRVRAARSLFSRARNALFT